MKENIIAALILISMCIISIFISFKCSKEQFNSGLFVNDFAIKNKLPVDNIGCFYKSSGQPSRGYDDCSLISHDEKNKIKVYHFNCDSVSRNCVLISITQ